MRIFPLACLLVYSITLLTQSTLSAQDPDLEEFSRLREMLTTQASQGDYEDAIETVTKMMGVVENDQGGFLLRGELNYMIGNMEQAVSDFDKVIELAPQLKPRLWQRGLALYYLERYQDGVEQFEVHQTVNGQDVENAVWHFACTARSQSLEKAREQLIPIQNDTRVPMMQIHQLFAGTMQPDEVLSAAVEGVTNEVELARNKYYAHFYIGLFHDANGDSQAAIEQMKLAAAEDHQISKRTLMGQVANVHLKLRGDAETEKNK